MESNGKMVAFIACAGEAAGKSRFATTCTSCEEAIDKGFIRGECKSGCVGVGSCVEACSKGAITIGKNGKITVNKKKCDGCGDCTKPNICPQGLIKLIPANATNFIPCSSSESDDFLVRKTCEFGCIDCGECQRACPEGAISIINNHAVIDYDKCVSCAECTVACKKKIIIDTLHDLAVLKDHIAFVKCTGDGRAKKALSKKGISTCKAAKKMAPRLGICQAGCFGCGDCVKACRYDAIKIKNGIAVVDPNKCVGCKGCVFACPQGIIDILPYKGMKAVACSSDDPIEEKEKYCFSGCIYCEACINNCPTRAIYGEGTHAIIDPDYCVNCNVCQYVCPTEVIRTQEVPEYINVQRDAMTSSER